MIEASVISNKRVSGAVLKPGQTISHLAHQAGVSVKTLKTYLKIYGVQVSKHLAVSQSVQVNTITMRDLVKDLMKDNLKNPPIFNIKKSLAPDIDTLPKKEVAVDIHGNAFLVTDQELIARLGNRHGLAYRGWFPDNFKK